MRTMRAKFKVAGITSGAFSKKNERGEWYPVPSFCITLGAVQDGSEENKMFGDATPSGYIKIEIVAEPTGHLFKDLLGKEVYVDFTPA